MGGVGRQARVFIWFFVEFFVSSGPRRGPDEGVPRPTEVFIEFFSKLFRTSAAFLQFSSPGVPRRAERRADFWCVACLSFFRKLALGAKVRNCCCCRRCCCCRSGFCCCGCRCCCFCCCCCCCCCCS